jgi:regulatory protein
MQVEPVVDAQALRRKAIALLARRDRSRSEMQQLLGRRCPDSFLVAAVLDELQARGWLSEGRLAEQLIHSQRSRAGAARLRRELSRRGLDPDVIAAASAGLESGDRAAALALWRRRFGTVAADRRQRERQLRFLLQRGFGSGLALEVLRIAGRAEGDSDMSAD